MVQLRDIEALDNGARFLNVDLHIHSYGASSDVQDATMTPQAIVDSAVAQGLSVIAIADHNSNRDVEVALGGIPVSPEFLHIGENAKCEYVSLSYGTSGAFAKAL